MLPQNRSISLLLILALGALMLTSGCQELGTLERELVNKIKDFFPSKHPFAPRDGITIRSCSLYQTANQNSEVLQKLPAETPVHLVDKIGEWFRATTRDGREGYLDRKVVGGEEIIAKTRELKQSLEGIPTQAEGVVKSEANFRFEPGKAPDVVEKLPLGKKFEMYERVVTLRSDPAQSGTKAAGQLRPSRPGTGAVTEDALDDSVKKDVWYKVKINDDGRVGYLYTHNIRFTPPEEIAKMVPWMRLLAWRTVSITDDPDLGAKRNYVAAYTPVGKDPGCDFISLYFMNWSTKTKKYRDDCVLRRVNGMLPITNFKYEGKPGFSIRHLHPTKRDKLVLVNYVFTGGRARKVSEEEVPAPRVDGLRVQPVPAPSTGEDQGPPDETGQQTEE